MGASNRSCVIIGLGLWLALVPPCFAQWVMAGQPAEDGIDALAARGDLLFAATSEGRIFLSTDSGASWRSVSQGLPAEAFCTCLVFAGPDLLVGTGHHGIFVSADDRGLWKAASTGLPEEIAVICLHAYGEKIFAGTTKGLFLSTDGGASWSAVTSGLPKRKKVIHCIAKGEGQLMGIRCERSTYISTNGGVSWGPAATGLPRNVLIYCLAAQEGNLLAGTELHSVQIFDRASRRWAEVTEIPPCEILCFEASGSMLFAGTGGGLNFLLQKDSITAIRHGAGVLMSADFGVSWKQINAGLRPPPPFPHLNGRIGFWVKSLAVCGTNLYAANELGEVWRLSVPELGQKPPR